MIWGMLGVLIALVTLLIGIIFGFAIGRARTRVWLEEHGCYHCQEKYDENPFNG